MSGMALINLIQKCTSTDKKQQNTHLHNESQLLKQTLLQSYTGARMRRIFDWTLSNIEDDVTSYTKKLSEMEMRLFSRGAQASHAFTMWKLYGTRRIHVSETALRTSFMGKGVGKGGKAAHLHYKAIITLIFSNCSLLVLLLKSPRTCIHRIDCR